MHSQLFDAIAAESMRKSHVFNPQNLSNTLWAFAVRGVSHDPLLTAIAAASLRTMRQYNPQNISNLAWACEVLRRGDGFLGSGVAEAASAQFLRVADESRGLNWVDLRNALPATHPEDGSAVAGVIAGTKERVLEPLMRGFLSGAASRLGGGGAATDGDDAAAFRSMREAVDEVRLPHLGPVLTSAVLSSLGVPPIPRRRASSPLPQREDPLASPGSPASAHHAASPPQQF